jgi:hypothetical protein
MVPIANLGCTKKGPKRNLGCSPTLWLGSLHDYYVKFIVIILMPVVRVRWQKFGRYSFIYEQYSHYMNPYSHNTRELSAHLDD